jgi:hypothetical protein
MKPVYDIIGYKLINASFHRDNDSLIEYFKVTIPQINFNQKTRVYELDIDFEMKFVNCNKSLFVFKAAYIINDLEWMLSLTENQVKGVFLSGVFPYIRTQIHRFTDDLRGNINIPVIDLRTADLSKSIEYTYTGNTK